MRRTLLQVVQSYLHRTDGFYVDSIYDTDEATQLAYIAEDVFYNMSHMYPDLLYVQKDLNLDAYTDSTKPNYLKLPENILEVQESRLWYNNARTDLEETVRYEEVKYLPPLDFNDMMSAYNDRDSSTEVIDTPNGTKLVIQNNKFPEYFTSYDGETVVFDSYHKTYDDTLQASKSKIVATESPVFLIEDDFIIPVPTRLSEVYLDSFLDEAMSSLYGERNPMIAQRARAGKIRMQQDSRTLGSAGRSKPKKGRRSLNSQYGRSRGVS